MSNGAIEFVKTHKVAVGVSVVAVIAVVFVVNSLGNSGASAQTVAGGSSDAQIQAGMQLQALQQQSQVANNNTAAALQAKSDDNATALAIATLQSHSTDVVNTLAAGIQSASIAASEDVTKYTSSLQYQTQQNSIDAQLKEKLADQSTIQYQAGAQVQQTTAILAAQTEQARIAAQPKGLFSFLFG